MSVDPVCAVLSWSFWSFWSFWSLSLHLCSWPSLVHPREHWSPSSTALQKTANMWRFPRCRMVCISQVSFWCTWQDVWRKHVKMYDDIYIYLHFIGLIVCLELCWVFIQVAPNIPYIVVTRFSYVLRHAAHKLDVRIRKDRALETHWNAKAKRRSSWAVNVSAMIRWNTEIYGISLRLETNLGNLIRLFARRRCSSQSWK